MEPNLTQVVNFVSLHPFHILDRTRVMIKSCRLSFCLKLFTLQSPIPNAYTLAISGRKPFIVLHTALLELLTAQEVQVSSLLKCKCNLLNAIDKHSWASMPACLKICH